MQDRLHVLIILIAAFVEIQEMLTFRQMEGLVKHAQHLVQPIIDLPMQQWYLDDNTVVRQTVDKRIRYTFGNTLIVVVIRFMMHIEYRLIDVTYPVAKDIDCHHWHSISLFAIGYDVLLALVLHAEILAEAQRFCF